MTFDLSLLNEKQLLLECRRDFVVEDTLIHAKKRNSTQDIKSGDYLAVR